MQTIWATFALISTEQKFCVKLAIDLTKFVC